MVPVRSGPRPACGTTTSVLPLVVTGTLVPLELTTVKAAMLASDTVTCHQQNVREHDPAVLAVERGHRVLVALTDPAQQLNVVAGPLATGGEGGCAGVPMRIVHLRPPQRLLLESR